MREENASGSSVSDADLAAAIRVLSMDAVEAAKSGHPGLPMGMADVATVLFTRFLKYDAADALWPDRDRFVLSGGHGSMLLYALLHLTGYPEMTMDQIRRFRQLGSKTPGHPEVLQSGGIETTTGPLGQGLATAVGMALAERILNARFGDDLVDHHTYVMAGDGDMMEGVSHEAAGLAGHLRLSKLIVFYDDNHISIDGPTSLSFTDDTAARFRAYGWDVQAVDGHDTAAVAAAITQAQTTPTPSLIACRTLIGKGAPNKQGSEKVHGNPLGAEEIAATRRNLGWTAPPFEVPAPILEGWREAGRRGAAPHAAWKQRLAAADPAVRQAFTEAVGQILPADFAERIDAVKAKASASLPKLATRAASGAVLEALVPHVPLLIGGSADLTPSNNTYVKGTAAIEPGNYGGRYIHFGVREHGMAAALNGLALHGGLIPYGGTFLTFSDYCRPSIRLAALMRARVVFVMTHDSIGLGEDGPTHQPVEHVAALRAIPDLHVFRPADLVETAECWELAIKGVGRPALLALTRQNLPTVRTEHTTENLSARGAYILRPATGKRLVTLFATGSEVSIAVEAWEQLQAEGIGTAVVSMPSWDLFERQDKAWQDEVIGEGTVRIAVEAQIRFGWDRYIGRDGTFIGMKGFGESAPYQELYQHFGITKEAVVQAAREKLKK